MGSKSVRWPCQSVRGLVSPRTLPPPFLDSSYVPVDVRILCRTAKYFRSYKEGFLHRY
jgi:hypothetical protein